MLLLFSVTVLNDYLFGKQLFISLSLVNISLCACAYFPFGFKGGIWLYEFLFIACLVNICYFM